MFGLVFGAQEGVFCYRFAISIWHPRLTIASVRSPIGPDSRCDLTWMTLLKLNGHLDCFFASITASQLSFAFCWTSPIEAKKSFAPSCYYSSWTQLRMVRCPMHFPIYHEGASTLNSGIKSGLLKLLK